MHKLIISISFLRICLKNGYTVVSLVVVLSIIGTMALIVLPQVSVFKAKGQQSESRIQLMKVYNALYAFKAENGHFPVSQKPIVPLFDFKEISPYLRIESFRFANKKDNILIMSREDKFVAAYVKTLTNKNTDIQRINSKKKFCYMLNGVKVGKETCEFSQNLSREDLHPELLISKKLSILSED